MKKIKHYTGKSLDFYTSVLTSKRDEKRVNSLIQINGLMSGLYDTYDDSFNRSQLHSLSPDPSLTNTQRRYLGSLYSFDAAPIRSLMNQLTTNEHGQVDKACPFCTINSSNTFDHILPQSVFHEYAVHPLNLIPCCSECNGHKGIEWKNGNALKFLNLYQDDLPDVQYLFVNLIVVDGIIKVEFYVSNPNGIDANLFARIHETYTTMQLCRRFKERCAEELSELAFTVQKYLSFGLSDAQIISAIQNEVEGMRKRKGYNYWKAILKEACCKDVNAFHCLAVM